MIVISYIVFVIISIIIVCRNKFLFIPVTILISGLNPIIQKLTDSTLQGATWNSINFFRMWPEYMLLFYFLVVFIHLGKINSRQYLHFNLLTTWVAINFVAVFFSQEKLRSFLLFPIVYISSFLFYYIIISIFSSINRFELHILFDNVKTSLIIFISIGILLLYYEGGVGAIVAQDYTSIRTVAGVWIGNHGIQAISLFIPLLLILRNNPTKYLVFGLILFSLFVGASRMSYIIIFVVLIYYLVRSIIHFRHQWKFFFILLLVLSGITIFSFNYLGDYFVFLFSRFGIESSYSNSLVYNLLTNDLRFEIWREANEVLKENFLFGIGMGNFTFFNSYGFSDAHNIFMSIIVETGVFSFIIFVLLVIKMFLRKNSHPYNIYLKLGLVLFILNGVTGSQLFIVSGFVNTVMSLFFFMFFAIDEIAYNTYKNT